MEAVLFDCDGVLVDSEPITNGVLHAMLSELGWQMSAQECFATFVGHGITDQAPLIQKHTGQPVTGVWLDEFRRRRDAALLAQLQPVANIHATVKALQAATQGRMAVASGADYDKVILQLTKVDLLHYFEGRIFSGMALPRNKPHPDVYWTAAKALGVPITRCAVIEDTPNGAKAGVASGASVFGYVPDGQMSAAKAAMQAVGVVQFFNDMADLPALLASQ
jgi:HAD superfamily hydrolase (TIGR01509 family)